MIEVIIRHRESGSELARIDIESLTDGDGDHADYSVRFGVEKIGAVGLHQRGLREFPRKEYNVLALLLQALNTLDPDELRLTGNFGDRDYSTVRRLLKRKSIWE